MGCLSTGRRWRESDMRGKNYRGKVRGEGQDKDELWRDGRSATPAKTAPAELEPHIWSSVCSDRSKNSDERAHARVGRFWLCHTPTSGFKGGLEAAEGISPLGNLLLFTGLHSANARLALAPTPRNSWNISLKHQTTSSNKCQRWSHRLA